MKQVLYILTVTEDGAVPVQFRVESGNTTDDQTHQTTWDLLCQLSGRRDFLYVADSKLATRENMAYVHQRGGRFLTVLPRTRSEDEKFRQVTTRFDLSYTVNQTALDIERRGDGAFPPITNVLDVSELDLLWAYKKQPKIEKRFSQMKTDFVVAPVHWHSASRIEAFLCIYFFALLVEALLERELRQAMKASDVTSLPLYPEGRPCRCPTTRRVFDAFDNVQRHNLTAEGRQRTVTELSPLQHKLLKLLGHAPEKYGR